MNARAQGPNSIRQDQSAADITGPELELVTELVRLHCQVLTRLPFVQLLLVLGLALLMYRSVEPELFLGWGVLTELSECLRAAYAHRLLRRRGAFDPLAAHRRLTVLASVVGGTIGLGAMLFMARLPLASQALLTIILFAMPAAGVSVAASSRQILAAYSVFILLPTATAWAIQHPDQAPTAIGLTVLYWSFIIGVAADGEKLLRRSVAIRRELDRAVKDLEKSNAEVRSAVAQAEQSSKARARVLAAASHDLRQPLHALSVYSAVLSSNPAPGALPEIAHNIDRLIRNLGGLLHGLLDLSRLSAEHYQPERQFFHLNRVVADVCNEYTQAAADKGLRLVCQLEPVRLYDDPLAAARITRNLLDNAIKYTQQGEVRLGTHSADGAAILTVEDTGRGIPLEEQPRVFEEFYQLDNPGRDHSRGVGLGLAIVQRLCELTGAAISLVSEPGAGACFRIRFFSGEHLACDEPSASIPQSSELLRGKRIYVVDDEPDILGGMRRLLHAWEVHVETAASPEAVEALFREAGRPHLLIVDLRLHGEEDGASLARRMQITHGQFPVVVVTGETAAEALQRSRELGYPLLQKPIAHEVLHDVLCAACAQHDRPAMAPTSVNLLPD